MQRKTVFSNLIWRLLERGSAQIVAFVVSIVLARLLDPSAYGTVALVTVLTTILQVFVDSGLGTALIQKLDADDLDFSTVFFFNCGVCLLIYGLLFLAAPLVAAFYGIGELTPIVRAMGLVIPISCVRNIQQSWVSRNMQFRAQFIASAIGALASAAAGIGMALLGVGVWALVAQAVVNQFIGTIVLWAVVPWRPSLRFSISRLRNLFSFGWKMLVASLVTSIVDQLRQLVIGRLYSTSDLAYYNYGDRFPNVIVSNVNTSIDSVLFPALSSVQQDIVSVKAMMRRAIKTSSFVIMPLMAALAACSGPIVSLVLGDQWLPCVPYLCVSCIVYAFYPIHTANLNAIKALGRSDIYLKVEVAKKVISVAILLVTMWHGPLAIAAGLLVSSLVSIFINAWPNSGLLGYTPFEQLIDVAPSIGLSLLAAALAAAAYLLQLSSMATLLIQITVGAAVYLVGVHLLHLESFEYVVSLVRGFASRR